MLAAAEAWFVRLNQWLIIALMGVMATLVFANVVSRYVFNYSIIWVEELTQYQMIWIVYLGAGLALREGRHVAVDLVQDMLPCALRRAMRIAIGVAMLLFLLTLMVLGLQITAFTWIQETPVLGIPTGLAYLGVPIGAAVCALHLAFVFRAFAERRFEAAEDLDAHSA